MSTGSMFLMAFVGAAVAAVITVAVKMALKKPEPKMTFQEFLQQISNSADEYMLKEEKNSQTQFIGGDCHICRNPEMTDTIFVQIKIYSKNTDGNWQTSTIENKIPVSSFAEDAETQAKLEKLKTEVLQMKVTVPDQEENLC